MDDQKKAPEQVQTETAAKDPGFRVKSTPPFKLKDRERRQFVYINLKKQFGFVPETIIVQKIRNSNNGLVVHAVLTREEMEREDAILKARQERITKHLEAEKAKVEQNAKPESPTPETKS